MPVEMPARPEIIQRDFYEVLEVPHTASEAQIRAAYRKLVRKWHPDRHITNKEEKARRFMEAHEAYMVLTDPDSRHVYDGLYHPAITPPLEDYEPPSPPKPFSQPVEESVFDTAQDATESSVQPLDDATEKPGGSPIEDDALEKSTPVPETQITPAADEQPETPAESSPRLMTETIPSTPLTEDTQTPADTPSEDLTELPPVTPSTPDGVGAGGDEPDETDTPDETDDADTPVNATHPPVPPPAPPAETAATSPETPLAKKKSRAEDDLTEVVDGSGSSSSGSGDGLESLDGTELEDDLKTPVEPKRMADTIPPTANTEGADGSMPNPVSTAEDETKDAGGSGEDGAGLQATVDAGASADAQANTAAGETRDDAEDQGDGATSKGATSPTTPQTIVPNPATQANDDATATTDVAASPGAGPLETPENTNPSPTADTSEQKTEVVPSQEASTSPTADTTKTPTPTTPSPPADAPAIEQDSNKLPDSPNLDILDRETVEGMLEGDAKDAASGDAQTLGELASASVDQTPAVEAKEVLSTSTESAREEGASGPDDGSSTPTQQAEDGVAGAAGPTEQEGPNHEPGREVTVPGATDEALNVDVNPDSQPTGEAADPVDAGAGSAAVQSTAPMEDNSAGKEEKTAAIKAETAAAVATSELVAESAKEGETPVEVGHKPGDTDPEATGSESSAPASLPEDHQGTPTTETSDVNDAQSTTPTKTKNTDEGEAEQSTETSATTPTQDKSDQDVPVTDGLGSDAPVDSNEEAGKSASAKGIADSIENTTASSEIVDSGDSPQNALSSETESLETHAPLHPPPEANQYDASTTVSGAATPRPNRMLHNDGIPESILTTPKESGQSTPWGGSGMATPLSDTSNWTTRPQSSRARSASNMMRDHISHKGDSTSGTRTPATVVGTGHSRHASVDTPFPRGILKDPSSSKMNSATSPPPIPPMTAGSGNVPAEWVYPLHVPLETLYTGARLRYRVTRYLLSGQTQESYVDIEVKPGWRKGTKIRFAGLGNERAPPMPPQDVIFIVDEVPHPKFRREGANLFTTCDISLLDALCQTRHVIQGLDGQDVIVDVGHDLAGGIIRPGDISRVAGMGMPVRKNSQVVSAGDLIIKWNIVFPDRLTGKQRDFIRLARDEDVEDHTAPETPVSVM